MAAAQVAVAPAAVGNNETSMIKKTRSWLYSTLLIATVAISMVRCESKIKQDGHSQKTVKDIDKSVLLAMIDSLAGAIARQGSTVADGRYLLLRYQHDYKLLIQGKPKDLRNADVTFVNISDQSYLLFVFGLSKPLQKQLSFKDLQKAFGKGKMGFIPEEPVNFSTMFQPRSMGNVIISVTSANLPDG